MNTSHRTISRTERIVALLVAVAALIAGGALVLHATASDPAATSSSSPERDSVSTDQQDTRTDDRGPTDAQPAGPGLGASDDPSTGDEQGSSTDADTGTNATDSTDSDASADPDYADGTDTSAGDGHEGTDGGTSFGAEFLAGQWYSAPSYGGAETYTILGADYDGVQRGGRAYWPNGVSGNALNMPVTGGNEYPFLWELSGDLLSLQFYSGRIEQFRVVEYDPANHEMWVDDGSETRLFIGCRSPQWPLPGATAPGC